MIDELDEKTHRLVRRSESRHGFRLTSLSGVTVYRTSQGGSTLDVSPLRRLLAELIDEDDVIQLNSPDLSYDRGGAFRGRVFPTSAVGYKNGFFVASRNQSLILPAGERDRLLDALPWLNTLDAWCVYRVGNQDKATRLRSLLESQMPSDPADLYGQEKALLDQAFTLCDAILCPAGDGAFLDIWSQTSDPTGLPSAISKANEELSAIGRNHGSMRFDANLNAYLCEDE